MADLTKSLPVELKILFDLPTYVNKGWVIKERDEETGEKRYDFQYRDKDGYRVTMEGLSRGFDKEFWNYAKLISGVLRRYAY
ncbi:MAG: hypothetical protein R2784_17740 [Saprospiraceae bacterium]